jgi:hypothetical protein
MLAGQHLHSAYDVFEKSVHLCTPGLWPHCGTRTIAIICGYLGSFRGAVPCPAMLSDTLRLPSIGRRPFFLRQGVTFKS